MTATLFDFRSSNNTPLQKKPSSDPVSTTKSTCNYLSTIIIILNVSKAVPKRASQLSDNKVSANQVRIVYDFVVLNQFIY